ncbi:hypothetical protein TIFTF001_003213 [Ficus carica]|uniref:Phytocyanin domain-containing protein n=1 Tax=Ficus carica TaxID=3494 RepID=A0AA87ZEV8_FICCA|nr:hypothetical protein TIFTF001_003213 [Ficus carica]
MANLGTLCPRHCFLLAVLLLSLSVQTKVLSYQYKVGDLNAWGIPSSSNPQIYAKWSKYHTFGIGDSLLFLYPPSQDSVIQVKAESYNSCNLKDPILYMNNGNSLFNITAEGEYFFTSGKPGHCEQRQRLHILAGNVTATAFAPSDGPSALSDSSAPSYPTVFGTIPAPPSSSPSSPLSVSVVSTIGFVVCALIGGTM